MNKSKVDLKIRTRSLAELAFYEIRNHQDHQYTDLPEPLMNKVLETMNEIAGNTLETSTRVSLKISVPVGDCDGRRQ